MTGSASADGRLGLVVIDDSSAIWCAAVTPSALLAVAAGTRTGCSAFACWSATVLPLQKGELGTHCGAEGSSAGLLVTLGSCWGVSVQCCCAGWAQAAGLHFAAEASPEMLEAEYGAPAMLHVMQSVKRDICLNEGPWRALQLSRCLNVTIIDL